MRQDTAGSTGLRCQELAKLRLALDGLERADGIGTDGFHGVFARAGRMDAQMERPRAHEDPFRSNPLLDGFGDVPDQELLDLEAVSEGLDELDNPPQAGDDLVRLIGDVDRP